MNKVINDILKIRYHRQYPLPRGTWIQYQEWHQNLLMHWKVEPSAVAAFLPEGVTIDTIDGQAWVSMIAFSVKRLRPKFLPHLPMISNFHEVNFRTYVVRDGIPGIYFLSIEAEKLVPVLMARLLVGLPYEKSMIRRCKRLYCSRNTRRKSLLKINYNIGESISPISKLDYWLTERHALYQQNGDRLFRIDIHHKPWPLQTLTVDPLIAGYPLIGTTAAERPDLTHYAKKLAVLVWPGQTI